MPDLREALRAGRRLLLDGATGTEQQRAGLAAGACGEAWNLDAPERVLSVHRAYVDAGADALTTNSFGGTRLRLALHDEEERGDAINEASARLAREAAGSGRFVLGSLGPTGCILAPLGDTDPDEVRASFLDQARALLRGGADAILVETALALDETRLALDAAREAGAPCCIASFAFDHTRQGIPRTMMGVSPGDAARAIEEAGVDVLGANCGTELTSADWLAILHAYRETSGLPILARPNAGSPELGPEGAVYAEKVDAFVERALALVDAGAALVGGCCGTGPAQIAALGNTLGYA